MKIPSVAFYSSICDQRSIRCLSSPVHICNGIVEMPRLGLAWLGFYCSLRASPCLGLLLFMHIEAVLCCVCECVCFCICISGAQLARCAALPPPPPFSPPVLAACPAAIRYWTATHGRVPCACVGGTHQGAFHPFPFYHSPLPPPLNSSLYLVKLA